MKTKLILLSTILLFSCGRKEEKKRKFTLSGSEDNNWSTASTIECDSIQMLSLNKAFYYIDGHKFTFYSKLIKIQSR